MLRRMGAVLAGVVVVGAVVMLVQGAGSRLYPLPDGLDPTDPASRDAFAAYLKGMPTVSWALAFGSEPLGAFLGALTAARIGHDHRPELAAIVVVMALAGSAFNWVSFVHPTWFVAGQLVAYPLVLLAAVRLLGGTPDPSDAGDRDRSSSV